MSSKSHASYTLLAPSCIFYLLHFVVGKYLANPLFTTLSIQLITPISKYHCNTHTAARTHTHTNTHTHTHHTQDAEGKKREKADRLRFGRFYYRFPDGESGADVYDRLTIFEDHVSQAFCL